MEERQRRKLLQLELQLQRELAAERLARAQERVQRQEHATRTEVVHDEAMGWVCAVCLESYTRYAPFRPLHSDRTPTPHP